VEFPAESIRQHVITVNDVSEQMSLARSAVREVTMDSQAYGQLCQFLPSLLTPLFGGAAEAMSDAVEALAETSLKLRATVLAMEATDAANARALHDAAGPAIDLPL
jgi:hypothetical protein